MQIVNNTVFDATASSYGPWFDMAQLNTWSLHIIGLETGGTLTIYVSNEPFLPTTSVQDANAATLETVTGTGAPLMVQANGKSHWMQIRKTASGTPTLTVVNLFGQIPY